LEEADGSQDFDTTLTETAVNSRVFQDTSGTTVTMTGYSGGTTMNVAISASTGTLPVALYTTTLTETSGTSLQFVNCQVTIGDITPSTPSTDGEGVFYVQFPGSTATSITLVSGSNSVTTTASPVTGQPNLLRTGKLLLLSPGDSFSGSGITTLTVAPPSGGGSPTVQLQMYGQTIVDPGTVQNAYVGECYSDPDVMPVPSQHLPDIQGLLNTNLGWTCSTPDESMTKTSALAAIPTHSLWYSFGHGLTTNKDAPPFVSFQAWTGTGGGIWAYGKQEISPTDVTTANTHVVNGQTVPIQEYKLVFINGCFSADTSAGSQAQAFITAFNADSYVGWSYDQHPTGAASVAHTFFAALVGKDATVGTGVDAVMRQILDHPDFFTHALDDSPPPFVALKGSGIKIQIGTGTSPPP
jgi:hypothetical protein